MTGNHDYDPALYPYRAGDLEKISPSQVREGDLIAGAGPEGSGVFSGRRVTSCDWAGYDQGWKDDTYRVETQTLWGPLHFVNPERIGVWRVTDEARARHERKNAATAETDTGAAKDTDDTDGMWPS